MSGWDGVPHHEYEARRAVFDRPWMIASAIDAEETGAIEAAISYLEEDPWIFRSGYGKATLLRRLKHADGQLSDEQRDRLRRVLVHYVDIGQRWDLREACSLARALDSPWLRAELVRRLHDDDERLALRSVRMLVARRRLRLDERDVGRARDVLLVGAARLPWLPTWTAHAVRRLWSPTWGHDLVALAEATEPPLSTGAQALLRSVPKPAARVRETSP
jgi:hypothetical protein